MSNAEKRPRRRTWCCGEHELWTAPQKRFRKYQHRRDRRREGKNVLLTYEEEYHLNQHLEPFNWVLDEEYGMFDLIQDMQDEEEWDWDIYDDDPEPYEYDEPYDYYGEDLYYDDYYD